MLHKVVHRSTKSLRNHIVGAGISSCTNLNVIPSHDNNSLLMINKGGNGITMKKSLGMINNQERNFSTLNIWRQQQQQETSESNLADIETQYTKDVANNNDYFLSFAIVAGKFESGKPAVFVDFLSELIQKKDVEGLKMVYYLCTKEVGISLNCLYNCI